MIICGPITAGPWSTKPVIQTKMDAVKLCYEVYIIISSLYAQLNEGFMSTINKPLLINNISVHLTAVRSQKE